MHVMLFGTYNVRQHPRVGVLREGLRHSLDEFIECNAPLELPTEARIQVLKRAWHVPPVTAMVLVRWWRLAVQAHRLPRPDVVVVGYLGHLDINLARLLFPRARLVLDQLVLAEETAADRDIAGGALRRALRTMDRLAVRRADLVVVDTAENAERVPLGVRVVTVSVGAEQAWFEARTARRVGGDWPLRVVFFGLFTPLQGTRTIGAALALVADQSIDITMIGHGQDTRAAQEAARSSRRVAWTDWVDAERLPTVVADHDVCLGIFGTTAKAARVVPTKVCQGAAAGCAIVTSDTPPQRRILGDAAEFVPPGDARALAETLRNLATDRTRLIQRQASAARLADAEFRPERVVQPLLRELVT